jgi:hypothetical protein
MRRTAVIATSVMALLGMGAFLAASGGAQEQGGQTINLVTKNFSFKFIDHRPRARGEEDASAGDQFVLSGSAFKAGERVGRVSAQCTFTRGGKNTSGICSGVYALRGGDIYLAVRLRATDTIRGAVVGGTGEYVGARGTFTSVDRKGEKGGDPSDDTITLLP